MKLNDLKKAAARAYEELQLAEGAAADLQRKAKADKARSEKTRLDHKRARKSAKLSKKLALKSEEQVREQRRVLQKAQKRLAKALKKLGIGKGKQRGKPVRQPAVARLSAPPKPTPKKQAATAPKTQSPVAGARFSSAVAGNASLPPVNPAV
jgi:hypothetical protein